MIIRYQIIYKHLINKVIRQSTYSLVGRDLLKILKEKKYNVNICNFPLVVPELNIIILSISQI